MNDVGATVARKAERMAAEVAAQRRTAVAASALVMKRAVEAERDKVAPGGRLRNVGKRGVKLGVRYDLAGDVTATALLRATGAWPLIERDTRPHLIVAKGLGRSRKGRQARAGADGVSSFGRATGRGPRALGGGLASVAGGPRAYARHPGTTGRQPWAKGIAAGYAPALEALRTSAADAVMRGWSA